MKNYEQFLLLFFLRIMHLCVSFQRNENNNKMLLWNEAQNKKSNARIELIATISNSKCEKAAQLTSYFVWGRNRERKIVNLIFACITKWQIISMQAFGEMACTWHKTQIDNILFIFFWSDFINYVALVVYCNWTDARFLCKLQWQFYFACTKVTAENLLCNL